MKPQNTYRRFGSEESQPTHNKFQNNEQLSGKVKQKIIISPYLPNRKLDFYKNGIDFAKHDSCIFST